MKKTLFVTLCLVVLIINVEGRKTSRSRSSGSGRGTSRKTSNPQPVPTSFSNPQASAPKPTLFGWQEKPAHNAQTTGSRQAKPSNSQNHGYPSSQTGLSGNSPAKPPYQENIQRSGASQQNAQHPSSNGLSGNTGSAGYPQGSGLSGAGPVPSHSAGAGGVGAGAAYPPSKGLSGGGASYPQSGGGTGTGGSYPQGSGLSGGSAGYPHSGVGSSSGVGYPQGSGASSGGAGYPHANSQSNTGVGYAHGGGMPGGPPPPYSGYKPGTYNNGYHPPPPYSGSGYGGGQGFHPSYTPQMPGYFGNYGNSGSGFGGVSRSRSALSGLGIAGAGVGTILTGLALWNLARSTGHHHHTVIYDNRGQPVAVAAANDTDPAVESILKDLVNCTLTISSDNSTEVLAIPCAIATSFTPEADVKDDASANGSDNTKCTVTIIKKTGQEYMTTIPCSILLKSAAENNVTEPPPFFDSTDNINATVTEIPSRIEEPVQPSALKLTGDDKNDTKLSDFNCTSSFESGTVRDPINPCYAVTNNLTVLPLGSTEIPTDKS